MIQRGKYCDLHIRQYYIQGKGIQWEWKVADKSGLILDAQTGYPTKGAAKAAGRRILFRRDDELKGQSEMDKLVSEAFEAELEEETA